jgi:2-iminobutanoate/2-iminopropanoate deaminase
MRKAINIKGAVTPAGQYSHAVIANGFVFVSGQGPPIPPKTSFPTASPTRFARPSATCGSSCRAAGVDLGDVVKVNTYLSDVTRFREYNEIYKEFFAEGPPARTTVGCQLVGIQLEIDCIAVLRG